MIFKDQLLHKKNCRKDHLGSTITFEIFYSVLYCCHHILCKNLPTNNLLKEVIQFFIFTWFFEHFLVVLT